MVPPVVGDPVQDRALHGHAGEHGEADAQPPFCLERAVREVAVEADGHAEDGDRVPEGGHDHVHPVQTPAPHHGHGRDDGEHRDDHEHVHHDVRGEAAFGAE